MVRNETFPNTNETVLPYQTFSLRPPCCLHLSGGEQVGDAGKRGHSSHIVVVFMFHVDE
jgi:hypothetical protein